MLDVRVDHGAQRVVLQVRELRHDERVCVGRRFKVQVPACVPEHSSDQCEGRRKPAFCVFGAPSQAAARAFHENGKLADSCELFTGGQEPGNHGCLYLSRIER